MGFVCSLCVPVSATFSLLGMVLRVLHCMPQKFGTAQSYQSASENCIVKKSSHEPMSYRP